MKPIQHSAKLGDIFCHSWGYDQTNIDFYEVVEVLPSSVRTRRIASKEVDGSLDRGYDSCYVVAQPGRFLQVSQPELHRVKADRDGTVYLPMTFGCCMKWDGHPEYCSWGH